MFKINKPGLLTTVQDLGRYGYQKVGIVACGAMDQFAHRVANLLVGNEENDATLEITMMGPSLTFDINTLLSICGGEFDATINGERIRPWRTVLVKKGDELKVGSCRSGFRAYLAIAGGIDVPAVMGSKSTYLRAGIGGYNGRALKAGDTVKSGKLSDLSQKLLQYVTKENPQKPIIEAEWSIASDLLTDYDTARPVRVVKGRQFNLFTEQSLQQFYREEFDITPQSDRMGYRLKGAPLSLETKTDMLSEAVSFGTIQVPSDGQPIILTADRQTTGGYPKIAQIASVDFSRIAQLKPGDKVRFTEIAHSVAEKLYLKREHSLLQLKQGLLLKTLF